MTVVLVLGSTRTAAIDGISAAGADPMAMLKTPAVDAELVADGRPRTSDSIPVSPTGCPTPALVTRAVREVVGFDLLVVEAGVAATTSAPSVQLSWRVGGDVREIEPVPNASTVFEAARDLAVERAFETVTIGESIPGGTTIALGVLRALGEPYRVSSSLAENPTDLKRAVVAEGLRTSGLEGGGAAGDPMCALRSMGDPVLAAVAGFVTGAVSTGTAVTLAGGTQMLAAAALLRHAGVEDPLSLATTRYVADDVGHDLDRAAAALDLDLVVTDPGFDRVDHPALEGYVRGEAKEGVAMGGALELVVESDAGMGDVRRAFLDRYDDLVVTNAA